MNWQFCPHCETQLDDATGICPACRWDPLEAAQPAPVEPEQSLMERYRGTEYDSLMTLTSAVAEGRSHGPTTKVKALMVAGIIVLFGLYGGILAWTTIKDGMDGPAVPASIGTTR